MGEVPVAYRLIKAARWLGVAPWDLAREPIYWREWIYTAMEAEAVIAEAAAEKARRPQGLSS